MKADRNIIGVKIKCFSCNTVDKIVTDRQANGRAD